MNLHRFLLTFAFLLLTVAFSAKTDEIMAGGSGTEFNRQAAAFAVDLYQTLIKGREKENIVISPLSIHTALGLAYMGAGGSTKTEMSTVLRIPEDKEVSADRYRHVLCKYKNSDMLKIANKIYVQEGKKLSGKFLELAQKNFKSDASNINFAQNAEAAKTINSWVEDKTANKIKDLIDPGSLSADTRLVLVNAIHFKGKWQHQFKKEFTRKDDFWISETESVKVDMMSNNKAQYAFGVFENLDAQAIELPFEGEDLSMLIVLPNTKTGLPALEAKLNAEDLLSLRKSMHKQEVVVSMPKFQIEFSIELNEVLSKMGMATMFSESADFSELLENPEPLRVSKVVHKAFIDVNEEGAEAAAATGFEIEARSSFPADEIYVNRPYLFAILTENSTVFIGREGFYPIAVSRRLDIKADSGKDSLHFSKVYILVIFICVKQFI